MLFWLVAHLDVDADVTVSLQWSLFKYIHLHWGFFKLQFSVIFTSFETVVVFVISEYFHVSWVLEFDISATIFFVVVVVVVV